jgi:hypothetical protein
MASGPLSERIKSWEYHAQHAGCSVRHLRRLLRTYRTNPVIHSKRRAAGAISKANRQARESYGHQFNEKDLEYFKKIGFTDEAHIDRGMAITQYVFREQGNPDGLFQEQPLKSELALHVAAFVSWDLKGPLLFYNDDQWTNETILNAYKQAKPRRRPRTESEDEFDQRVKEWENLQPLGFEKQGNTMTELYYAQKILPHYVALIEELQDLRGGQKCFLLEDGDPSHGHRSRNNLPHQMRLQNDIELHPHPAQSLDLNAIEGIRLLLQEMLKKRWGEQLHLLKWRQFRDAIQSCWNEISQEQIRDRIRELPARVQHCINEPGILLKGARW